MLKFIEFLNSEIFNNEFYNEKCDVFSFAIIMFELLMETNAPYGKSNVNIELKVAQNPLFRPTVSELSLTPSQYWIISLMTDCWKHEPADRPGFATIVEKIGKHMDNLVA